MYKNIGITSLLWKAVAAVVLSATTGMCARPPADNHFFVAGALSWHLRDGFFDFGNNRVEHIELKTLRTQGIAIGKNFCLPLGLRLGVPVRLEYGKVAYDTVSLLLDDGTEPPLKLNAVLALVGLEPTLQLPWQLSPKGRAFFCVGAGIHYAAMAEEEITMDGTRRRVVGDPWLEEGKRACFSVTAGQGFERTISAVLSLNMVYNFRFWEPVKRSAHRDLFPVEAVPYTERFFTHSISVGLLFSRHPN